MGAEPGCSPEWGWGREEAAGGRVRAARVGGGPGGSGAKGKEVIKNDSDFQYQDDGWARLVRSQYARRLKRRLSHLLWSRCGLDDCQLLMNLDENLTPPLLEAVRAKERERVITMAELDCLLEADYIARARGMTDGVARYVVVEAALTVDDRDIERARSRAATLERATAVATLALVVGETVSPPQESRAQGLGVTLLLVDS